MYFSLSTMTTIGYGVSDYYFVAMLQGVFDETGLWDVVCMVWYGMVWYGMDYTSERFSSFCF